MPAPKGNKNAVGNEGGRPDLYKPDYHPKTAYKLTLLGATDKEMADIFGVNKATLNKWKKEHVEFIDSLTRGKVLADAEIATSMFKRAKGYKHPETKYFVVRDGKDSEKVVEKETIARYPPDTKAAAIWLSNRRGHNWRERAGDDPKIPPAGSPGNPSKSTPFTIIDPESNETVKISIGAGNKKTT